VRSLFSFVLATLTYPLFLVVLVVVTGLMLAGGAVPYRPGLGGKDEPRRLPVGALDVWWLSAAWLAVAFLRAFVVPERQPLPPHTTEISAVRDAVVGAARSADPTAERRRHERQ
jgi:hypothetical protein